MGIFDRLRAQAAEPNLYRRAWRQTSDPLVAEARAQTLALQRLGLWLRLAYSALALAVLLGYWGFAAGGNVAVGIFGVVAGVLALACVLVLRTGIARGRANVQAMLDDLERRRAPQ